MSLRASQNTSAASITGQVAVANGGTGAATPQLAQQNLGGWYILAQSAVPVSCGADTTEDTLATITVPANAMGANGSLRFSATYSFTNNGNTKTVRVRYSGGAGTAISTGTLSTQTPTALNGVIANRNATNSQYGNSTVTNTGIASQSSTIAVDTTQSQTIVITGQKASAGDTLTLERYMVELAYGA